MKNYVRKEEILFCDEWLSLKKVKIGDLPPITYMSEHRCESQIVAILPFTILSKGHNPDIKFLVRREYITAWNEPYPVLCSITGGLEKDKTPIQTALIEFEEESGYKGHIEGFRFLGNCYGIKSSDTKYHLFCAEVNPKKVKLGEKLSGEGDGSEWEKKGWCEWVSCLDLYQSPDPILHVLYSKFRNILVNEKNINIFSS